MSPPPPAVLVLFGRSPASERCKTRLARALGDRAAASRAYDAMVRLALHQTASWDDAAPSTSRSTRFFCAEPTDEATCVALLSSGGAWARAAKRAIAVETQRGDDVGARVAEAFERVGAEFDRAGDAPVVCVAGTDVPMFTAAHAASAVALASERADAVAFGPGTDGGFYCVAARATRENRVKLREAFRDAPWSTERALEACVQACAARGLSPTTAMETLADVDEAADLAAVVRAAFASSAIDDDARALYEIMRECVGDERELDDDATTRRDATRADVASR